MTAQSHSQSHSHARPDSRSNSPSMSGSGYVPGTWIAMTTPETWLLIDAQSRSDLWAACWNALRESADAADVLAVIAHEGAAGAPDFALVRCDGNETRVVVRGSPSVELAYGADATTQVRAVGGGDWTDRLFTGMPFGLRLANVSEPGHFREGTAMPLECGVAQASTVGFGLGSFVEPPPAPLPPAVDVAEPDFNLDGFLLRNSTETTPLPLDDMSWLGDQTTQVTTVAPVTEAATLSRPAPEPVLPSQPPVVSEPAPEPVPSTGLSFDAEATTFRPGRTPVQIGGFGQSVVLAVSCPAGHANPPDTAECRVCRLSVPAGQQPRAMSRPALGRLRLSTGEVHVLDRGFLLGRSPVPRAAGAGPEPNVLRLISRDGDVSRTHAEIRLEGWQVIVADLGSTNGTYVSGPGLPPRVLSGGDEQVIEPGYVVTLANDVWIAYEVAE